MSALAFRRGVALAASLLPIFSAAAAEPAIIARARAYLGAETALESVKSVRYVGTLISPDAVDPNKKSRAAMEIIFQRPDQQRITAKFEKATEITALNGYEGFQQTQNLAEPAKSRQIVLRPDDIKRLRANTWENLSYYRGIERLGGRMEEQGTATIDGVTCQKIAFIHAPNIIFYRYFEVGTGRLVFTETESGGEIREQGEIIVNGIRFPKSIITTSKNPKGAAVTVTIEFEKITVNEVFPSAEFAVPSPVRR